MVVCGAVLLPLAASQAYASEETPQETVSQATPAPTVKNGLLKEGRYYCYYKKGKKIKNRWVNIGSNRYFFNTNGHAVTNSMKRGQYVYVFDLEGKLYQGCNVESHITSVLVESELTACSYARYIQD